MDGSVLGVLAAYQNNLVTSKMMTTQVVQCLRVENVPKIRLLAGKSFKLRSPNILDQPEMHRTYAQ